MADETGRRIFVASDNPWQTPPDKLVQIGMDLHEALCLGEFENTDDVLAYLGLVDQLTDPNALQT